MFIDFFWSSRGDGVFFIRIGFGFTGRGKVRGKVIFCLDMEREMNSFPSFFFGQVFPLFFSHEGFYFLRKVRR